MGRHRAARLRPGGPSCVYVRRVLDESLRLWPTAPAFAREARHDTVLGGVHPMRRGAWALVLTAMLHRDPAVWGEDAEAFDPDRFDPAAVRARPAHAFKPFGTGARACIGRQFALHEATLVLGLLLRRYDVGTRARLPAAGRRAPHADAGGTAPAPRPPDPGRRSDGTGRRDRPVRVPPTARGVTPAEGRLPGSRGRAGPAGRDRRGCASSRSCRRRRRSPSPTAAGLRRRRPGRSRR